MAQNQTPDWRTQGVRIVHADQVDPNTPQTPGMTRAAAINRAMAGANKLFVPHQEMNASPDAPLFCVLVRSDQEPVGAQHVRGHQPHQPGER